MPPSRNTTGAPGAVTGRGPVALVVSGRDEPAPLPEAPFRAAGVRVLRASGLDQAERLCAAEQPRLVFLPILVDGARAARQLAHCLGARQAPVVVVIAGNDQINAAAEAMRAGAFDCLFRPFSEARLARTIEAALKRLPAERGRLAAPGIVAAPDDGRRGMVIAERAGPSSAIVTGAAGMRAVVERATALAGTDAPVLISGEVGTGKSLLARVIHEGSPRAGAPLVAVNCATLGEAGLETAFAARGGTLLLEEICDLEPRLQPRLAELLDAGPGTAPARVVAATAQDPRAAVQQGRLRGDLFYRLNVAPLAVPPLRERPGDVALIARTMLGRFAEAEGRGFTGFSDAALARLEAYDWPGNVRELINLVWSIVLTREGPVVTPAALPPEIDAPANLDLPIRPAAAAAAEAGLGGLVGRTLAEIERAVIEATIAAEGGSVPRAARVLDVSPSTLYRKREGWAGQT